MSGYCWLERPSYQHGSASSTQVVNTPDERWHLTRSILTSSLSCRSSSVFSSLQHPSCTCTLESDTTVDEAWPTTSGLLSAPPGRTCQHQDSITVIAVTKSPIKLIYSQTIKMTKIQEVWRRNRNWFIITELYVALKRQVKDRKDGKNWRELEGISDILFSLVFRYTIFILFS